MGVIKLRKHLLMIEDNMDKATICSWVLVFSETLME